MTSKYIATNPWSERSLGTAENAVYDSGTMTAAPKSASDYRINVSFTGIKNDYTYPTSYTLCVIKRKGTGALYNIIFH